MRPIFLPFVIMISIPVQGFDSTYKKYTQPRSTVATLTVKNGGKWGSWVHTTYCPPGMYARGFSVKLEPDQGSGDDSALNNIALLCTVRWSSGIRSITSSPAPGWGKWSRNYYCNAADTFLTSFILQVEPDQDNGDDSAANFVNFRCRRFSGGQHRIIDCGAKYLWGHYGEWSDSCPPESAICGMSTKWEPKQGLGDDSALNDVKFYCCK